MKTNTHKSEILDRVKRVNNISNNAELARFLDVNPATISNWYTRNSIDYDLVFSKCVQCNINWLLTGEGNMFLSSYSVEECDNSIVNEPSIEYKTVSSKKNNDDDFIIKLLDNKEKKIEELNRYIGKLEHENSVLRRNQKEMDVGDAGCADVG